jgi:myosin-1
MRLRLGLLHDTSANIEKAEKAEALRRHNEAVRKMKESEAIYPGDTGQVRSDVPAPLQKPADGAAKEAAKVAAPRIRPLSESKAIDAGANFISEFFLFSVAGTLIFIEALRSKRKETTRRDTIQERLDLLEARKRQDQERLEEQEREREELKSRVLALEEQLWRSAGGKGEFPGARAGSTTVRLWQPTPLWESKGGPEKSFWQRVWGTGGKEEIAADEEVVLTSPSLPGRS